MVWYYSLEYNLEIEINQIWTKVHVADLRKWLRNVITERV